MRSGIANVRGNSPRHQNIGHLPRRKGLVLLTVLICLLITCVVLTGALRISILAVRQTRINGDADQAEWLAEAGWSWGQAALKADPDWKEGTWRVLPTDLNTPHSAEVVVTLVKGGEGGEPRRLRATARYPIPTDTTNTSVKPILRVLERPAPAK